MSFIIDWLTKKETSFTGKTVTPGMNSLNTITAWEHAQMEGKTFHASYFDTTGITAGISYYYN